MGSFSNWAKSSMFHHKWKEFLLMNKRQQFKEKLILERRVMLDGCEGQAFKEHECVGGWHLHEAIFSKRHFQHLKGKSREYFELDRRNCAILCSVFHEKTGHTRDFKEWWVEYANKYGDVEEFISNAPLVIKA